MPKTKRRASRAVAAKRRSVKKGEGERAVGKKGSGRGKAETKASTAKVKRVVAKKGKDQAKVSS